MCCVLCSNRAIQSDGWPEVGRVEILKQNLAIEPDLQNFTEFVLKSVGDLGGNVFAATIAVLGLLERLRHAGAALGNPIPVSLALRDRQLIVRWGQGEQAKIVTLSSMPAPQRIAELRSYLEDSVALVDPEILLQRNIDMKRHFEEVRARGERDLEALQQSLKRRQTELTEIMRLAETDALTGLYNRRAFDARLKQVFLHTMRQRHSPVSLLLLDLDHFKAINDEFGHQAGDAHLVKMAAVLRNAIREDVDFAFRFGGDEFAVVLYADYPQACEKSKQVLSMMSHRVSIGVATVNEDTDDSLSLEDFIRSADIALYEAKRLGRGQAKIDQCASQRAGGCHAGCPGMAC
jgi:diguanylate cyclase (GGDEF)-like protein